MTIIEMILTSLGLFAVIGVLTFAFYWIVCEWIFPMPPELKEWERQMFNSIKKKD